MNLSRCSAWPEAEVYFHPSFLSEDEAGLLCSHLQASTPWEDHTIRIQGNEVPVPRRTAWYDTHERAYGYSGLRHRSHPWTPELDTLRARLEEATGASFNSVLLNLYRDGRDSVSWHADDEAELGPSPTIASLSLGAERMFRWKPKQAKKETGRTVSGGLRLPSGSLLVMAGATQQNWVHAVPKTTQPVGPRVNLTFRWFSSKR